MLKGLFKNNVNLMSLKSPISGEVINITQTKDLVFSSEALGKGVGILPNSNTIVAPIDGEVVNLFPTKHAIGIKSYNGIEILIHIGIETVELNGQFFSESVRQGDKIKQGDKLIDVDFEQIKNAGYDTTVLMVVTNSDDYKNVIVHTGSKSTEDIVLEVTKL